MLIKLVRNVSVREHDPIDRDKFFGELGLKAAVLINFRSHRSRIANSDWRVHRGIFLLLKKPRSLLQAGCLAKTSFSVPRESPGSQERRDALLPKYIRLESCSCSCSIS